MKTFRNFAAQGEITIQRIGPVTGRGLPKGCTPVPAEAGNLVIGHSETGHHHVMDARSASVGVMDRAPEGMRILHLIVESATPLVHLREHDTHEPILHEPGEYVVRIGREYDPYQQLSRMQAD